MKSSLVMVEDVTSSKVDKNHRLRCDAILNIFQDLATSHATEMGMSFVELKEKSNAFWVLSKIRYSLNGNIHQGDSVECKTWPLQPTAFRFIRDFKLTGNNGQVLGSSEWCVLDWTTGGIRKFSSLNYPEDLEHISERSEGKEFSRLKEEIVDSDLCYEYKALYTDIDCNGHVNNVSYSKMALNAFTPDEFDEYAFNGFEIHFTSQTYFGDIIKIYKKTVENGVYIEGQIDSKTVFKAKFEK